MTICGTLESSSLTFTTGSGNRLLLKHLDNGKWYRQLTSKIEITSAFCRPWRAIVALFITFYFITTTTFVDLFTDHKECTPRSLNHYLGSALQATKHLQGNKLHLSNSQHWWGQEKDEKREEFFHTQYFVTVFRFGIQARDFYLHSPLCQILLMAFATPGNLIYVS